MKVSLEHAPFSCFLLRGESGASRLVQFDADFQPVAISFGWSGSTDENSVEAIWNAYEFLENAVGAVIDDPGYF